MMGWWEGDGEGDRVVGIMDHIRDLRAFRNLGIGWVMGMH